MILKILLRKDCGLTSDSTAVLAKIAATGMWQACRISDVRMADLPNAARQCLAGLQAIFGLLMLQTPHATILWLAFRCWVQQNSYVVGQTKPVTREISRTGIRPAHKALELHS